MNKVTAYIAAGATVLVLFGSVIEVSESMPDNAFVYADTLSVKKAIMVCLHIKRKRRY